MKISVVMCTYNGEKYIQEQLLSILHQTRKPNELIICDDKSEDNTIKFIYNILESEEIDIKLVINQSNKGYKQNFIDALRLVSGDIIFLSDQDDIFALDKLEEMEKIFKEHEECYVLNSRYIYIDEKNNVLKSFKFDVDSFNNKLKKLDAIDYFYKSNFPGFTMAFRKNVIKELLCHEYYLVSGHDIYLNLIGLSMGGCYLLNMNLNKHRIHNTNASRTINDSKLNLTSRIKQKKKELENLKKLLIFLEKEKLNYIDLKFVEKKIYCLERRIYLFSNKKILRYSLELLKFKKFYPLRTLIADLIIIFK